MWQLLPLLVIPVIVVAGLQLTSSGKFTIKEFFLLEAVMAVLIIAGFSSARWGAMSDTEFWNGRVSAKDHGKMSCCHCSTECDTCTDSDGRTSSCNCHEECDHYQDYKWTISFTTGDTVIAKKCSGWNRPPAVWTNAVIGEPAAIPHTYTNYLKADPDSVLRQSSEATSTAEVPAYPRSHDIYKVNRAINVGTSMPQGKWNVGLMNLNADLGKEKQVNIVVLATNNPNPTYAKKVEEEWLYGKKNDVIFVLGAPDGENIKWAQVVTISRVELLKIHSRDQLRGMKLTDPNGVLTKIRTLVDEEFTRSPMSDYEYLAAAAKPSPFALFFLYALAFVGAIGGSFIMIQYDVFNEERSSRFGRYKRW